MRLAPMCTYTRTGALTKGKGMQKAHVNIDHHNNISIRARVNPSLVK